MACRIGQRRGRRVEVRDQQPMQFEIGGDLTTELVDDEKATRALVARELEPFAGAYPGSQPDFVLQVARDERRPALVDIHGLAADGVMSASDGRHVYALINDRLATIPDPWRDSLPTISYERGFPVRRLISTLVRPTLQVLLGQRNVASVHAASVDVDGSAVLVAGWSESGKTETALALMEDGGGFLSDKWTLLAADGLSSTFPISVGVRRWVLDYLPTLRSALSRGSTAQFRASAAARAVLSPVLRARTHGRVLGPLQDAARQAVALGDRVAFTPNELRAAYGQRDDATRRIPTRMLVLLTTVPDDRPPVVRDVSREWTIERLVRAAAFERRPYFAWLDRVAYSAPERAADVSSWLELERAILRRGLESAEVLHIEAPFPVDPRRVATLISERLR
jgi:hypothetical protein